jgi:RNA polymerase sigma factor (TIGR02999 family)
MSDVTQILSAIEGGDAQAAERLLPLVYDELRKLATARMTQESPDHTLQATALVHEAYLRLVGSDDSGNGQHWDGRGHFFAAAAEAMRRILVERARRKSTVRHGGEHQRRDLNDVHSADDLNKQEVIQLDDALDRLEEDDPRAAELVKLRFFAGLSVEETASLLGISARTARRTWVFARARLRGDMEENSSNQL